MPIIAIKSMNGKIDRTGFHIPAYRKAISGEEYKMLQRAIEIGMVASALRNLDISILSEDEREEFFEHQRFFIGLEASCFDNLGFE